MARDRGCLNVEPALQVQALQRLCGAFGQVHSYRGTHWYEVAVPADHEPGDRLGVFPGQVMPQEAFDLVKVHIAGKAPPRVPQVGGLCNLGVVFVRELADDLLGEVLNGQDAIKAAVLVDDAGQLIAGLPHAFERNWELHRCGKHDGRAHGAGYRRIIRILASQQVDQFDHAHRGVAVIDDRVSGVTGRHESQRLTHRGLGVDIVNS